MIRRGPLPERSYVVVGNEVVRDRRLSWKARGLLIYLLSRPEGWTVAATRLAADGPDGRDAVLSGLRELETVGYLVRRRVQGPSGRWRTESVVYDSPELAQAER